MIHSAQRTLLTQLVIFGVVEQGNESRHVFMLTQQVQNFLAL